MLDDESEFQLSSSQVWCDFHAKHVRQALLEWCESNTRRGIGKGSSPDSKLFANLSPLPLAASTLSAEVRCPGINCCWRRELPPAHLSVLESPSRACTPAGPVLSCKKKFRSHRHWDATGCGLPQSGGPVPQSPVPPQWWEFQKWKEWQINNGSAYGRKGGVWAQPTERGAGWSSPEWLFQFCSACLLELSKCVGHSGRARVQNAQSTISRPGACWQVFVFSCAFCLTFFATDLLRVLRALATMWTRCARSKDRLEQHPTVCVWRSPTEWTRAIAKCLVYRAPVWTWGAGSKFVFEHIHDMDLFGRSFVSMDCCVANVSSWLFFVSGGCRFVGVQVKELLVCLVLTVFQNGAHGCTHVVVQRSRRRARKAVCERRRLRGDGIERLRQSSHPPPPLFCISAQSCAAQILDISGLWVTSHDFRLQVQQQLRCTCASSCMTIHQIALGLMVNCWPLLMEPRSSLSTQRMTTSQFWKRTSFVKSVVSCALSAVRSLWPSTMVECSLLNRKKCRRDKPRAQKL